MTHKRARVLGAPYAVPDIVAPLEERFARTGHNTGNLLIGDALVRQVDLEITGYGTSIPPSQAEQENDLILVPSANFLYPAFDFAWLADYLEHCKLPVLMVGLGAQSPGFDTIPELPEGTVRMLHIVAERSASIGVRGRFTATVLESLGIKNVTITGCPSLFRKLQPSITIRRPPQDRPWRVSLNGSRNVLKHSASAELARTVERALLQLGLRQSWDYVLQNEFPEIPFALKLEDPSTEYTTSIVKDLALDVSPEAYAQYFAEHGRVFFAVDEWEAWMSQQDLSFGSRFHGNMMALSQGVPAIVVAHDSRTTEMCEFLAIPHVHIADLQVLDIRHLAERADYSKFERRYPQLLQNFRSFLEVNGVPHRLGASPSAAAEPASFEPAGRIVKEARAPVTAADSKWPPGGNAELMFLMDPVDALKAAIEHNDLVEASAWAERVPLDHAKWSGSLLLLGEVLLGARRPREAESWFRQVLATHPNNEKAVRLLYRCLIAEGRLADAQIMLAQAASIRPELASIADEPL